MSFAINAQQIEGEIYKAIDEFIATKNIENLSQKELYFSENAHLKKEKLALVILFCNKAFYLKKTNKNSQAIENYEKAWHLFSKNGLKNYDIIEYCLKPLGNLYTKAKNYTNAENIIKYYIFLSEKSNRFQQKIAGIINLSLLYQSIGKHSEVIELINTIRKTDKLSSIQQKKLQQIKKHSEITLKNNSTNNYQKLYIEFKKKYNNSYYSTLSVRERAKLYLEEAQLLFLMKEEKKAQKKIEKVIVNFFPNVKHINQLKKENLYAETLLIDAFDLLAELTPNNEEKIKFYDNSFYISQLLERGVTSQEAKIIHQNDNRKRSEKCIAILYELYKSTSQEKYFKKAIFYANLFKSKVLTEKVYKKILFKKNPSDSLLKQRDKLIQLQEKITNNLISEQTLVSISSKISKLSKQLTEISIRLKQLEQKIYKKYGAVNSSDISMEMIKEKVIKHKITLVNYFFGSNELYQFVIQGQEKKMYKITMPIDEIVHYIRLFNEPSQINNDIEKFTKTSFLLYQKLHLHQVARENNMVIIPDGLLNFIPFETLLTQYSSEVNFAQMPFLVNSKQITYSTSLHSFLQEDTTLSYNNVLGVFPVFSNSNLELQYSLDEKKSIQKSIQSTILLQEEATKSNFIKKADNFDILHFSTHAVANNMIPYIHFYNDKLTLNELYSLNFTSNLAILSACETGVGVLRKGEGVMSIARGFKYAGIKNLLFSLWKINDKSTSVVMDYFYQTLKDSKSVNYANWQSKKMYLSDPKIINSKKSPYYWGAFVYYGTFKEKVPKNTFSSVFLSAIGVLLILAIVFLSIRKTIRN